jgi:Fe-S cluster assembly scaffold protein SufB
MTNKRKTIKITIPSDLVESFDEAKEKAEKAGMMALSDSQYASRLVSHSVKYNQAAVIFSDTGHTVVGDVGSNAHKFACRAAYLLECDFIGEEPEKGGVK